MNVKHALAASVVSVVVVGVAACSTTKTYEVSVGPASLAPAAPASSAPASSGPSFTVTCTMVHDGPAYVPQMGVKNTGSTAWTLPDLAYYNDALSFDVKYLDNGSVVNEDSGWLPDTNSLVTIQPGQSQTFNDSQVNGSYADDMSGTSVNECTATINGY